MQARHRTILILVLLIWAQVPASPARDGQGDPITPEAVAQRIRQMKEIAPKDWTKIPWVASLVDARRVSKQERRPIFLFTFEGNMATGRC